MILTVWYVWYDTILTAIFLYDMPQDILCVLHVLALLNEWLLRRIITGIEKEHSMEHLQDSKATSAATPAQLQNCRRTAL